MAQPMTCPGGGPTSGINPDAPVGVFDSGVGGLSVLRVLQQHLPHEHWVYFADSAHAPYGEKTVAHVQTRSLHIAAELRKTHGIKALVVACNTATAEAIQAIRLAHPDLPVVGIEPGIKPALLATRTRHLGIMATQRTIESHKFQHLLRHAEGLARVTAQACPGLALAIEQNDNAKIKALISYFTSAMGQFGSGKNDIDTLVLGCTHYPLAAHELAAEVGACVALINPADGVARQLVRVLAQANLLRATSQAGHTLALSSARTDHLQAALLRCCPAQG